MVEQINISKESLSNFYERDKLTTFQIAKKLGCCQATIWKRLKDFNIKSRLPGVKRVKLTKEQLEDLYINKKLSTWKIENKIKIPRGTIYRKLKEFNINIRDRSDSHVIYSRTNFSEDLIEKAYLIGFRIGDLGVRKQYKNSKTICIASGSTVEEQIELIKGLFDKYGNVWIKRTKKNKINIQVFLNESFNFLLSKDLPKWIEKDKRYFFSFLAGFTDAEGHIGIGGRGQAIYSLGNYNKKLLIFIKTKLKKIGIGINGPYQSNNKGTYNSQGYIYNENYNQLVLTRKSDLLELLDNIKHYIKHKLKIRDLNCSIANILERNRKFGE